MSVIESIQAGLETRSRRPLQVRKAETLPLVAPAGVTVRTKDLCLITRQLATLLKAGMPLVPALSAMVEQWRAEARAKPSWHWGQEQVLADLVGRIRDRVNAGVSLSNALSDHPQVFGPIFTHMVAAGEAGGTLEEVLCRLADTLERRSKLQSQLTAALAYPIAMAAVAAAVVVFLLAYVVPGLTQVFVEMNRVLPWPTRALMGLSAFLKQYWIVVWVAACALALGLSAALRTHRGKALADRLELSLPWIGPLVLKVETGRLARTLGTLLGAGVPVLRALDITGRLFRNGRMERAWAEVISAVRSGDTLSGAIRRTGLFPPLVCHLVATGETSGAVEQGLLQVADMYDSDVQGAVKTLASLVEPVVLLAMGLAVGFIVLAILLPIFDINQAL
jgi:general secretion pathway protein F